MYFVAHKNSDTGGSEICVSQNWGVQHADKHLSYILHAAKLTGNLTFPCNFKLSTRYSTVEKIYLELVLLCSWRSGHTQCRTSRMRWTLLLLLLLLLLQVVLEDAWWQVRPFVHLVRLRQLLQIHVLLLRGLLLLSVCLSQHTLLLLSHWLQIKLRLGHLLSSLLLIMLLRLHLRPAINHFSRVEGQPDKSAHVTGFTERR